MGMNRVLIAAAATCALAATGSAQAVTLHGFCSTANPCTDNGTNTPTSVDSPNFGFSASPGPATGTVFIDILVPDNVTLPASYTISGPFVAPSTFTASLFSSTPWTSGKLDSYLGISASPENPIGAYLPSTIPLQPTATGFYVFQANLGTKTLPSNSGASNDDLMTTGPGLFAGSYVVAFIKQMGAYGATANSGAILETGSPMGRGGDTPEPATWALMLMGFGGVGAALRARRRRPTAAI